ncbi:MAG TPA: hypothetical protein ENK39_03485 [Epsilonproteobacteria bacterium]|nr:hypothetical protein [Campylobacterota bacterium]
MSEKYTEGLDKIIKAINLLSSGHDAVTVDTEGYITDFLEDSIPYFEINQLLIESLGYLDDGSKDKEILKLKQKQDDLLNRWERDELVSMKDFIYLTALSRDMIDKYIRKNPFPLKYYQVEEGTKLFFKKSDWEDFKKYMES